MIVVEFPSLEALERFIDEAENQNDFPSRENSASDYIWTLYESSDSRKWVSSAG